jgi:hypothetical protein
MASHPLDLVLAKPKKGTVVGCHFGVTITFLRTGDSVDGGH